MYIYMYIYIYIYIYIYCSHNIPSSTIYKCIETTTKNGFPQIQPINAPGVEIAALSAWNTTLAAGAGACGTFLHSRPGILQDPSGKVPRMAGKVKSCQVEVCRNLFSESESPVGLQIVVISLRCIFHKNMQLGFLCVSACRQHGCPALPPSHWLEDWTTMDKFDQVLGYNRIQNNPRIIIQSYHIISYSYCYILYTIASHLWQSSVLAARCALYSLSFSPAGSSPTWLGFSTMSAGKSPWINHHF